MTTITIPRAVVEQALEALTPWMDSDHTVQHVAYHALRAALAEPVEPVAWLYTGIKQDGTTHGPHLVWKPEYMDAMSASKGAKATPLYAAPPQRKPLTEEEIERLWYPSTVIAEPGKRRVAFGRAIERAHGIKE